MIGIGIDLVVQAHPARSDLAEALAGEIAGRVCYDPEPESPVKSPWRTYRHCIETAPPDASHLVVIQEDATACAGFVAAARAAIAARPDRVIVLCVTGNPPRHRLAVMKACERGAPWADLEYAHWLPAIAVAWPAGVARDLVAWVDEQNYPPRFVADDEIAGRFLRARGITAVATVPSLVDHDDVAQSIMSRRRRHGMDPGRRAFLYIDRDCDCGATSIDWTH
jgi:hypothetical protein